jgi:hyperosmotically inducible periplasmic protein
MLSRIALLVCLSLAAACGRSIDTTIQDATITAAVTTALLNDTAIDGTLITVRTEAGVVYLTGTQPTPEAGERAVSLARSVQGVADVQSSIRLGPPDSVR